MPNKITFHRIILLGNLFAFDKENKKIVIIVRNIFICHVNKCDFFFFYMGNLVFNYYLFLSQLMILIIGYIAIIYLFIIFIFHLVWSIGVI